MSLIKAVFFFGRGSSKLGCGQRISAKEHIELLKVQNELEGLKLEEDKIAVERKKQRVAWLEAEIVRIKRDNKMWEILEDA